MKRKALVLTSGGLDSSLAIALMQRQSIDIEAVSFFCYFSDGIKEGKMGESVRVSSSFFNIKTHYISLGREYTEMLKSAKFGFGTAINPCIDCKLLFLRKAGELMLKIGASFLVTGEVIGERPMSQKRYALDKMDDVSGLGGLILRPLSGKLFAPTIPEKKGIIDREKLLDINGRSRSRQIALAKEIGLSEYPNPAGGCILTDKNFAWRIRDLWKYSEDTPNRYLSARWGRHFRFSPDVKFILGRDERENDLLESLADYSQVLMRLKNLNGPLLVIDGFVSNEVLQTAAGLVKYFSKAKSAIRALCCYWKKGAAEAEARDIESKGIDFERIDRMLISEKNN